MDSWIGFCFCFSGRHDKLSNGVKNECIMSENTDGSWNLGRREGQRGMKHSEKVM